MNQEYLYYGQQDRTDELNNRINARYSVDTMLHPHYDPRPISTKFILFPTIDCKLPETVPIASYQQYSTESNFFPGTTNAPGYHSCIDSESQLRKETTGTYIPALVNRRDSTQLNQVYTNSFSKITNTVDSKIGNEIFFNHTRTQLRNT